MKSKPPPEKIFLQYYGDERADVPVEEIEVYHDDITWTADRHCFPHDVEYVRAELKGYSKTAETRKATLIELRDEIEMNFSFHYLGKSLAKFINEKLEGEG